MPREDPRSQVETDRNSTRIQHFVVEVEGVIDVKLCQLADFPNLKTISGRMTTKSNCDSS